MLFIEKPTLNKGQKISRIILEDNKGNSISAEWSYVCDDKKLEKRIEDFKETQKWIDKQFKRLEEARNKVKIIIEQI